MAETKYIIFALGDQKYSMKLSSIKGIEQIYNIVPVSVGAEFIKGIIHLRDSIIPIFDLKEKFEIFNEAEDAEKQLLVAESHNMQIGFEVDMVLGIMSVRDEDIKAVPPVVKSEETGCLEDVLRVRTANTDKTDIVLSISVDNIMSDSEYEKISNAIEETKAAEK